MHAHIDHLCGFLYSQEGGFEHGLGIPDEGDHGAVGIAARIDVEETDAGEAVQIEEKNGPSASRTQATTSVGACDPDHARTTVPGTASRHVVGNKWSVEGAVDPEQMLVSALSSCHMLVFLHRARLAGFSVTAYADANGGKFPADLRAMKFNGRAKIPYPYTAQHKEVTDIQYVSGVNFRAEKFSDTGGWAYVNTPGDKDWGKLVINCTHSKGTKTGGRPWTAF